MFRFVSKLLCQKFRNEEWQIVEEADIQYYAVLLIPGEPEKPIPTILKLIKILKS